MASSEPNDPAQSPLNLAPEHRSPFLDMLEIHPVDMRKGHVTFRMVVDHRHLRTMGILHGGVAATLLDTSLGCAAATTARPGYHVVTVQLNINYIRPAWENETLIAKGEVRHAGQQTAVASGELRTSDDVLVATATGTFIYLPIPKGSTAIIEKQDDRLPQE